ncbi:hypothetical protein BT69DRAFT_1059400 [Atractiella rhizophila]|nr:hypothetical protein BT69DRAFT_1059400 [Atractiella rhizophila]
MLFTDSNFICPLQTAKSAGIQHKLSSFTLISKESIPHTDTRALLSLLPSTLYTLQLIGLSSIPISSLSHLIQLSNLEFTDSVLLHPSLPLPPSIPLKKLTICTDGEKPSDNQALDVAKSFPSLKLLCFKRPADVVWKFRVSWKEDGQVKKREASCDVELILDDGSYS